MASIRDRIKRLEDDVDMLIGKRHGPKKPERFDLSLLSDTEQAELDALSRKARTSSRYQPYDPALLSSREQERLEALAQKAMRPEYRMPVSTTGTSPVQPSQT